jgi:ribosome maturation protein SDO1
VSKGTVAPQKDLVKAFGKDDMNAIIQEILLKGELQVGQKERQLQQNSLLKDIIEIVSKKTINPETSTPYTTSIIEKVLSDLHFNPNTSKNAKQQALEAINLIKESKTVPIERIKMKIKIVCDSILFDKLKLENFVFAEDAYTGMIDPEQYKIITQELGKQGKVYILE